MPLYEYKCKKCGHRFERIQSFSAEDVKDCPVCQGEVERLISTPARAHFKGSGFYSTDYAAQPASSAKSQDTGKESSGASASDGGGSSEKSGTDKGSSDKGSTDKKSPAKTESKPSPAPSSSSSKSE
jgi:putative FmdB family regulatory protein